MARKRKELKAKAVEQETKTRKYNRKSKRSKLLVGKNGRKYKKNILEFFEAIDNNEEYSLATKESLKEQVNIYVNEAHQLKERMSINGFFGRFETDKTDRLFRNLGYSTAEMADALGVSPLELKTQAKWLEKGTILELPDGRQYYFDFTYTGQVFTEIKRE